MNFDDEVRSRIAAAAQNAPLQETSGRWMQQSIEAGYSYNFSWLSRPVIQYPQDLVAMQELVWRIRPDLIIETGIAHGGSLVLSASLLALLDYCDAVSDGRVLDPSRPRRKVLGIDIDIRAHNRTAIETHPLRHSIEMIQGSSVDLAVVDQVKERARSAGRVLVCLDSNHTHEHVLAELEAYAPLVSQDSYCCVFDTVIEHLGDDAFPDRPWGVGNNPKTAVQEYLRRLESDGRQGADGAPLRFTIDEALDHKLALSVAPGGYLRRVPA